MTTYFQDLHDVKRPVPAHRVATERTTLYGSALKRLFDVLVVLAVAPFIVPAVVFAALLVRRDGHSPFYTQDRVGKDGLPFRLVKLRTMVPNADAALKAHLAANPAARAEWDRTQKLRDDPRVTRVGKFLRKSSLDELPQLWNVLVGDMSIVGPRPFMSNQRALYPGHAYYRMRPGISGLWQVSDRNEASFAERATFDDEYHRRLSFGLDLMILVRTVGVVIRCTGY